MAAADTQRPDETLGSFRLFKKLGESGVGTVYMALEKENRREVALKVLNTELSEEPLRRARFLSEINQAIGIAHPGVAEVYQLTEAGGHDLIAMEYVDGRTVAELLAEGPLAVEATVAYALSMAEGLAQAHAAGMVHRDIKPGNVKVNEDGHAKLLDLGLAKLKEEARKAGFDDSSVITLSNAVYGTPTAMSPEQALGRPIDERSDIFSFGSLLYEMVSGRSPFTANSFGEEIAAVIEARHPPLDEVKRGLPPGFVAVVAKAMHKQPAERYASMSALAGDLRLVQQGVAVSHAKPGKRGGLWARVKGIFGMK